MGWGEGSGERVQPLLGSHLSDLLQPDGLVGVCNMRLQACIYPCSRLLRMFRCFEGKELEFNVEDGENDAVKYQNAIQNVADMHVHGVSTDTT